MLSPRFNFEQIFSPGRVIYYLLSSCKLPQETPLQSTQEERDATPGFLGRETGVTGRPSAALGAAHPLAGGHCGEGILPSPFPVLSFSWLVADSPSDVSGRTSLTVPLKSAETGGNRDGHQHCPALQHPGASRQRRAGQRHVP